MLDTMDYQTNLRRSRTDSGWKNKFRTNQYSGRKFTKRKKFGVTIDINRFINKAEVTSPTETFIPQYSFNELQIHEALKRAIARRGFSAPTSIQEKTIAAILAGQDVIGLANTGTGKTAAFLIPMIHKILINPQERVLVVVPTRELAIQIQEEFFALAQRLNIFSVVIVGGASIRRQIAGLRARHNMVIGTPGRLKDLISRKAIDLSYFNNVVLDEADRMLDMGFINDVKLLLSLVAEKRQTLMFSATFSQEIENLVKNFLKNPHRVSIKTRETPKQIEQNIVRVAPGKDKIDTLHDLLIATKFEKALIFTRTKYGADKLSQNLYQRGFKSESIHGDKPHNKRQKALKMFKEQMIDILVATDVAARGLDIPNVSHVINFDLPATYEDYIHRIGRTGRANKCGTALTFVN